MRRRKALGVVAAGAGWPAMVAGLLVGCSGSVDPQLRSYCERVTEVRCSANVRCCTDADAQFDDVDKCVSQRMSDCIEGTKPVYNDSRIMFDEAFFEASIARTDEALEDCEITPEEREAIHALAPREGQTSAFVGTRRAGESCVDGNFDLNYALVCAPGLVCGIEGDGSSIDGTCKAPGTLGDSCHFNRAPCKEELYCEDGECKARRSAGAECTRDEACNSRLCVQNECSPKLPLGELCTANAHCETDLCRGGVCASPGNQYCRPERVGP